ncbi:protease pro-enzyme activation domain-containing protein [Phenylobacterium montanum]|uniref:Peptidase S53 activation domain-containing protein n=1 Tax=Phenylobacterium montanum TaxID=2823693 RepID=A0A975FZV7_9CAUL|nr:protease pro-enzyme activation domain-containing protein [Caulobacter sp. S6]QUD88330.1 hypothetical protein KCG34_00085 [Caulobacter sp. S6]
MANTDTVVLANSAFSIPPGARAVRRTDPNRWIELTVGVRRKAALMALSAWEEIPPSQRMPLSRADLARHHGPDSAALETVTNWAEARGLLVTREDKVGSHIGLAGTAASLAEAFEVELFDFEHPELGEFHARTGMLHAPPAVARCITGVFGFNNHAILKPPAEEVGVAGPWSAPAALARIHSCPAANVPGRTIGLVAFGSASQTADVAAYLSRLGLARPNVQVVPGSSASGGAAARPKLVVYFSTYDEKGLVDVLSTVIGDAANDPSVLSIGWGERVAPAFAGSPAWAPPLIEHIAESFLVAAHLGVSIIAGGGGTGLATETRADRAPAGPLLNTLIARLKSMLYLDRVAGGDTADLLAAFR